MGYGMDTRNGGQAKRGLVTRLFDRGFAVVRAPSAGEIHEHRLPDMLAGDSDEFYAITAYITSDTTCRAPAVDINGLQYFARNFGATALIAVRFNSGDWYCLHPNDLYMTETGDYLVEHSRATDIGIPVRDL